MFVRMVQQRWLVNRLDLQRGKIPSVQELWLPLYPTSASTSFQRHGTRSSLCLNTANTAVNFVKSRALQSRLFGQLCLNLDAMLYRLEVRWLSRGKVLKRVCELTQRNGSIYDRGKTRYCTIFCWLWVCSQVGISCRHIQHTELNTEYFWQGKIASFFFSVNSFNKGNIVFVLRLNQLNSQI